MSDAALVALILVVGMFALMAIGVSVSVSIGLPSAICLVILMGPESGIFTSAQKIYNGVDSFALLAIPLFVLAGAIMNQGGIASRLIDFAKALVGPMPGALAQTNVLACMLFGSISGSALAGASAVGAIMAPEEEKSGYDMSFAAAVNIASAPSGMLIPPSNTIIVYALVSQASVGALFLAGYIPGILWALTCMVLVYFYSRKHPELKGAGFPPFKEGLKAFWRAVPSLGLIIVVIGGIVFGVFTATEGAAVAVMYALILSLIYRTVRVPDLPRILLSATRTSSVVVFLIALSSIMSYAMVFANIPNLIADWLTSVTSSSVVFLLIMAVVLLIIGIPLDATPAVLIFTPIFLPIATQYGIHPVHLGIMMVFNMCIAVISPPSAPVLFVGARVAGKKVEDVIGPLMPFFGALIVMLLIVQYIPALSMWLPTVAGMVQPA
ncbi:MAG: TRAP transporter large permease [Propionibacteriaceae bacterium]|jgi:tripartite ATP-independent transporter DctM subunit|uniref:TRAP transporter large permease n=2 Tax=root TaxID=1 RepID=A0AAN0KFS1_9ACTN|nr:TRAP transporter large permease [Brooklawnia sp. SH051]MCB0884956.1 TRAP transporter large permease [Propionibacteriaceae bacterium]MEA5122135.1 TRAP transporter large permease [Propionibacterium sp.]BEH02063.1 TRAP transporter large permease [Brooklawnia sp. SH051]